MLKKISRSRRHSGMLRMKHWPAMSLPILKTRPSFRQHLFKLNRNAYMSATYPKRGEIYYTDLDPVFGSEQGGRRPVLIIQNDPSNQYSPVVIVASITSAPAKTAR